MVNDPLTDDEIQALCQTFAKLSSAADLLTKAGLHPSRQPPFDAATNRMEFWEAVNRVIINGGFPHGRAKITAEVLRLYPTNSAFAKNAVAVWEVLLMGASPTGNTPIRSDRELKQMLAVPGINVTYCPSATLEDLTHVRLQRPHVLHLSAHGNGTWLEFDDGLGARQDLDVVEEARTLRLYEKEHNLRLRGIVLNACGSDDAAHALAGCADTVVGHRDDLPDEEAIAFAGGLYRVLHNTGDLAVAAKTAARELTRAGKVGRGFEKALVVLPSDG